MQTNKKYFVEKWKKAVCFCISHAQVKTEMAEKHIRNQ